MASDFFPSLTHLSAQHILISLWYRESILIKDNSISLKYDIILEAERHIYENMVSLVPNFLHPKIQPLIRHIGEQIKNWIKTNKKYLSAEVNLCKEIYWSPFGLIDFGKTAENIITHYDSTMLPLYSFDLACTYGVGSQICRLWPVVRPLLMTQDLRASYGLEFRSEREQWISLLSEQFPTASSVHLHSIDMQFFVRRFLDAVDHGNLELIKFHFQCLNPSRQLKYINEFQTLYDKLHFPQTHYVQIYHFPYEYKAPILLFFLQYMNPAQREEFYLNNPKETLICFLEWPLQNHISSVAEKVAPLVPAPDFYLIFKCIVQRMLQFEYESIHYINMFKSLWTMSPLETKQHCFHQRIYSILKSLFQPYPYEQALEVLLKSGDAAEKVQQAFFCDLHAMFAFLAEDNKYKAFHSILEKFIPDAERDNFESEYTRFTQDYVKNYYMETE